MKKAFLLLILAFLLLAGCKPWWNVSAEYDPRFQEIPVLGIASPAAAGSWLMENITYTDDAIHDTSEYWQSPDQTYIWRTGDCEDFVILMMYLIHVELGGWPRMAIGRGHAWVSYEGRWYVAQGGGEMTVDSASVLIEALSYGETMWRSMETHRAIGELEPVEE